MSTRYTRKDAERALERLASATGHRVATSWNDVGAWSLDYASCYGGFVVHEISTPGGGVSTPFGDQRRPAREFCDAVSFTLRALEATASPTAPLADEIRDIAKWIADGIDYKNDADSPAIDICDRLDEVARKLARA